MKWDQLQSEILKDPPEPGEMVYLERRGEDYTWRRSDGTMDLADSLPDAWMYYSGQWPTADAEKQEAFFKDMLAELESMTGGVDRCRWEADDPWPHWH
ncbi:MAG: hypothetical protein JWR88_2476 [Pseudonocardia sp.]|nr:hypothetical protein [Pseudonocardia sp.]